MFGTGNGGLAEASAFSTGAVAAPRGEQRRRAKSRKIRSSAGHGGNEASLEMAPTAAVVATLFLASAPLVRGQCAATTHPFVGGALAFENLLLFDGGVRFTDASGMVRISDIPADNDTISTTRCRCVILSLTQPSVSHSLWCSERTLTLDTSSWAPWPPPACSCG